MYVKILPSGEKVYVEEVNEAFCGKIGAVMRITVDIVMAQKPCSRYPRDRVKELWGGREWLTPTEVGELPVPPMDRAWLLGRLVNDADRYALYEMEGQRNEAVRMALWGCDITAINEDFVKAIADFLES
jgi:hypothetical protein